MKTNQILLYTCLILCILNTSAVIFCIYHFPTAGRQQLPVVLPTDSPANTDIYIPDTLFFAGEAVPLHRQDVQEALKKELIVNTYLHSHTTQILKTAPRMFAVMEPILKANNIPDDFKYLAVIESRLVTQIVSPAGAAGIWQIMKETGKELGLEINNEVDERYHISKATEAAAAYLRKSYEKFDSWTLAAASYNAGNNFLIKQMTNQKENNYYNLLLGEETERYVFRILALKQIMNHPEKYNFNINITYPAEPTTEVKVNGPVKNWADFAREQGITYKTLKRFNPWLRKTDLKNPRHKTYKISIPENKELYK